MDAGHLKRIGLWTSTDGPLLLSRTLNGTGASMNGAPTVPPVPQRVQTDRSIKTTASPPRSATSLTCGCCGFASKIVERDGHPAWLQPTKGKDVGLRAFNSLTGEKEPFIPIEDKEIRWYTCGPTVYDVAHMGHARAYLTFDILRRIMTKYFNYKVKFQINITDIDDKIIQRSRQNKLLADFTQETEGMDLAAFQEVVTGAVKAAGKKLAAKAPELPQLTAQEPQPGAPADAWEAFNKAKKKFEKAKAEYEKLEPEHALKMNQHASLEKDVAAAKSKESLLEAARDPLMKKLEDERKHTISDHSIFNNHARYFEDQYFEDMDALGVLRPDVTTRISDYMDGRVQRFIEKLEELQVAYESKGSVYFDIDAFRKKGYTYRKLSPDDEASAAEMAEGEGALAADDSEKRSGSDFALWKKSKPGEPAWDSKWGPGRPGWHIECSVMATDINGEYLDIHAGGEDLKFPHHDNECAQSEAYLGRQQWTNYFWHAGHLHIEGLKMSKSLKNFITIREALEMHSARQLRLMFLMQPWDKGMNYSNQAIDMARAEERKAKHFLGSLKFFLRQPHSQGESGEREAKLTTACASCKEAIGTSLRDNFGTGRVVDGLSRLISECYQTFDALPQAGLQPVEAVAKLVQETYDMLGVTGLQAPARPQEEAWITAVDAMAELRGSVRKILLSKSPKALAEVLEQVNSASSIAATAHSTIGESAECFKKFVADLKSLAEANEKPAELLKRCDKFRDEDCVASGIRLEDRANNGYLWMFDDKEVLERELREQAEKAAAAGRAKIANKLIQKRAELKTAEKAAIKPQDLFKQGASSGMYSDFDDQGIPRKLANGDSLSAKKAKDLAKEAAKQQKDHDKLKSQVQQAGLADIDAFLQKLQREVTDMEGQLGQEA